MSFVITLCLPECQLDQRDGKKRMNIDQWIFELVRVIL